MDVPHDKNLYIDRKRREAFETVVEQMLEEGFEDAEAGKVLSRTDTNKVKIMIPIVTFSD